MKKACIFFKESILFFSFLYAFFCFLSCGLDTFYVIEHPYSPTHIPLFTTTTSTNDYENKYFEFVTNEANSENSIMKGTNVYYKIYESYSTMSSHVNAIQTLLDSTTSSASASERLIDSYGYNPLSYEGQTDNMLIPKTGQNRKIYIRLTDYFTIYNSTIKIGEQEKGSPLRQLSDNNKYTFNFGRDGDFDKEPSSSDNDTNCSSSTSNKIWYVAMYAIGEGLDEYFQKNYSEPVYLGNIVIDSSTENN